MSFYFIGHPDPENPHRWTYNTGVHSTMRILEALREHGFHAVALKNSESIAPYLDEIDVSKPGATREEVEQVCAAADSGSAHPEPPKPRSRRFSI
jgi:hypothetical protein